MAPLEGPVGVGALFEAIMLGCVIVQSCVYYRNSRITAWFLSVLVSLTLFLLLAHLGFMAAWLWANRQTSTEDPSVADYASILFGISNVFGAMILFIERCFLSHRIMKVSNNHLLAFVFFIICIFSFTATLGAASIFFTNVTADLTNELSGSWVFPLVIISGLVCDLAISTTTAVCLRSQTPTEKADALGRVAHLSISVAETGFVTSFFNVATVCVYWLTKSNLGWVGLYVSMPGVFANAFLTALNARGHLCADIEHQRKFGIGDQLIDSRAKKPPISISMSKKMENDSEKSPV